MQVTIQQLIDALSALPDKTQSFIAKAATAGEDWITTVEVGRFEVSQIVSADGNCIALAFHEVEE